MIRRNISTILQKFNNVSNQKVSLIRCVSGSTTLCDERAELVKKQKEEQWNRIYIFDDMKYLAIVTRLKLYPALLTILGVPTAYFIQVIDGIPAFSVVPGIFVGKDYPISSNPQSYHRLISSKFKIFQVFAPQAD